MMGGTRFSPEGKLLFGLRKAGDNNGEGQFHDWVALCFCQNESCSLG